MDEDESRLKDLYGALKEQYLYYLDKQFQFPSNRSELIESPEQQTLKFEIFYEFYRSAMIWNKILILEKKHKNIKERRKLFKEKDEENYKIHCNIYIS